ncbi:MAG: hypothetical protein QY326_06805 [Bdellovibrionota bacterium]|nr:MAG: hypothetical protein QY326_06805 [Bdellovibrionota bacterium]
MSDVGHTTLQTEGVVNDYYLIESHLLSTRSADAYSAIDKSRKVGVMLWMLRHPLARSSEAAERFLRRMQTIETIEPLVCEMVAYGIDAAGIGFAVFPRMDGFSVVSGNIEVHEAERRFMWALRLIDRMHLAGVVCGDLCGSSFWVERGGDLKLVGALGSFDAEAAATAMVPPLDTLPYMSPEQRTGAGVAAASDVFALGVLGYYLFTKQYPFGTQQPGQPADFNPAKIRPIATFVNQPPVWADEVLRRCLHSDPSERYATAGAVLAAISEVRAAAFSAERTPVRSQRDAVLVKRSGSIDSGVAKVGPSPLAHRTEKKASESEPEEATLTAKGNLRMLIGGVGFLVLAAIIGSQLFGDGGKPAPTRPAATSPDGLVNEELQTAINIVEETDVELAEKAAQIDKIVSSDDPIAHAALVRAAMEAKSEKMRLLAEQAIIDRARRLGLLRSSEQVRQWLRTVRTESIPSYYEPILQSLDLTLPMEARNQTLRQAYPSNPLLVLRLSASMALDSKKLTDYQEILAQLVGDSLKLEDAPQHSTLALILAHPELALVYADDVIQNRASLPDNDILWLLKLLIDRNDPNVRPISSLAVERGVLTPMRSLFVSYVRDRADLEPAVIAALVRASAGVVRSQDVASFGRWYDVEAEKVLLAVAADLEDPNLAVEVFDTLAGKSLTVQPSKDLSDWVRTFAWDDRGKFTRLIGLLGHPTLAAKEAIVAEFSVVDEFSKDRRLMDILLSSDIAVVVDQVLSRYGGSMGVSSMLRLLGNPDPQIRMTAIQALKESRDIGVAKIIIDHYEREKDPAVREAYKQQFWFIQQREREGASATQ